MSAQSRNEAAPRIVGVDSRVRPRSVTWFRLILLAGLSFLEQVFEIFFVDCLVIGGSRCDIALFMEFSKRFTLAETWGQHSVPGLSAAGFEDSRLGSVIEQAKGLGYKPEDTLYDVLFATPEALKFSWPDPVAAGRRNGTVEAAGIDYWFPEKALFEEYIKFGQGHAHDLADFDTYYRDDVCGLPCRTDRCCTIG